MDDGANARNEALREWAKGSLPDMAGVELLIRSDWARRLDNSGWITYDHGYAWPNVGGFLAQGGYLSGGERRQVTIIASFLNQRLDEDDVPIRVSMANDLGNVDYSFIRLLQVCVGIAAGMYDGRGKPAWPDHLEGVK